MLSTTLQVAVLMTLCAWSSAPPAPAPCRLAPLCHCHSEHFVCSDVSFYDFPTVEDGVLHVSVSGARLGTITAGALADRALTTLLLHSNRLYHLHPRAFISASDTLASLDLGYNELTDIPLPSLRHLRALHWLNLQNNHIAAVPATMHWGALGESLTSLSLANNELITLKGSAFAGLHRLTRLDLEGNRLLTLLPSALPHSLASLQLARNLLPGPPCVDLPRLALFGLRDNFFAPTTACNTVSPHRVDTLDLSDNRLSSAALTEVLQQWSARYLLLDNNALDVLPPDVYESFHLERLSAAHNHLTTLSTVGLHHLRHLQQLELDHNELAELPLMRELTRCRLLSLSYNRLMELSSLPPKLHSLNLAGNFFVSWPSAALTVMSDGELRRLDLGYNRLTSLTPEAWGPWASALETLDLRGNHLVVLSNAIPAVPSRPPPLRELLLGFNDMYSLRHGALEALTGSLRVLDLSTSRYGGEFPAGATLAGLEWLALDNSELHAVSALDLAAMPALQVLNLEFNRLERFPVEISPSILLPQRLRGLRLAFNILRDVDWQYICSARELRGLDLSHNELRELPTDALRSLALRHLRLAGNSLTRIAPRSFTHLPCLTLLELQNNELTQFSAAYFYDVGDTEDYLLLNVSYNRISELTGFDDGNSNATSDRSIRVHILDLSHNRLTDLSSGFVRSVAAHLRRLDLSYNYLHRLELFSAPPYSLLVYLQDLMLQHNNISILRPVHSPALTLLDLRHNALHHVPSSLLAGAPRLSRLLLADNALRFLPRDSLAGAPLDCLDLSDNRLSVFPGGALGAVGRTLRQLELGGNTLEHLDAAMFTELAALRELDLARNALTVLPDSTFASLALLRRLDLARNSLKTNFKELFHNLPELRVLSLAGCGLRALPRLPLLNLTCLDLADNRVSSWRDRDLRDLGALRELLLPRNEVAMLRAGAWAPLPRLHTLDLSGNPLLGLHATALEHLPRLQTLRLAGLHALESVEGSALRPLTALRSLELDAPAGDALPGALLSCAPHVEVLQLHVRRAVLGAQLRGLGAVRLRALDVRGAVLRRVAAGAFSELGAARLALRLSGTALDALPDGLFALRSPLLVVDLSDNRLTALSPAVLYTNLTDWHRRGTTVLPGGLVVSGNPLQCGCGTQWLGAWLRRWAAETGEGTARAGAGPLCWRRGALSPLLKQPDAECAASALSSRAFPCRPTSLTPLGLLLLLSIS